MAKDVYITSNALKIHLLIFESPSPDSPVIVFIHATGFYAQYYSDLLSLLNQRGFTVIGMDLQGHGKSEGRRGDFTIKEVVQNVRDVVTFAIQNYSGNVGIFGASQGGIITFYVLGVDTRIKSAVCQGAAVLSERQADCILPRRGKILKRLVLVFGRFTKRLRLTLWSYIDRHTFYVEEKRLKELGNDPFFVRTYTFRSLHSLATSSPPSKIEDIKTPVMFIQPENDGIFPLPYIRSLYDKLACFKKLEVIPGEKHMFLVEHPGVAVDIIAKWFKETLK
jgi:pimeloyl-ACP methyl ester carboxylesterase